MAAGSTNKYNFKFNNRLQHVIMHSYISYFFKNLSILWFKKIVFFEKSCLLVHPLGKFLYQADEIAIASSIENFVRMLRYQLQLENSTNLQL